MILSLVVALTLSPALCATLLKPIDKGGHVSRKGVLGKFFNWFNTRFDRGTDSYGRGVERIVSHRKAGALIYGVLLVVLCLLFWRLPSAFLPDEDQGMLMVMFSAPAGATQKRTQQSIDQATQFILKQQEVQGIMTISGFSLAGSSQNSGMGFIRLRDWADREGSAQEVAHRITGAMMMTLPDAQVFALTPPAITGLGTSSGVTLQLQDAAGNGYAALVEAPKQVLQLANGNQPLSAVRFNGRDDAPTYRVQIDDAKAGALGVAAADINTTLVHGDGRALRQRLSQQQPGQACVRAGRSVRTHVARRYRALVCAQQRRRHGAVFGVRQQRLGVCAAGADALQRQRIDGHHRQCRTGHQLGRCDDRAGRRSRWYGQGRWLRMVGHVV